MENGRTYKQVADLNFGDIIKMKAPYEENTKDYYFGHNVKDVMGGIMVDHFGRPYKIRPVMVIGFENNELTYCTLTSTAESIKTQSININLKNILIHLEVQVKHT